MVRPPNRRAVRTVVALAVLGAVLLAAVIVTASTDSAQRPSVDANVTERYRSIEAVTATRTVVRRHNGTVTTRTVGELTRVPGTDRKRLRLRESGDKQYELRVSNGSTLWLHDSDTETVVAIELTGPSHDRQTARRLQSLTTAAGLTDTAGRPAELGVAPLPVVPRQAGTPSRSAAARSYTVEYVETRAVGAREAYVLNVTPETTAQATPYHQQLWLDTERFYPLRKQTTWTDDGGTHSIRTTYTNVTFDAAVSESTFRPELTSATTVQRPATPNTEWHPSVAELRAHTSTTVPTPSVPAAFELAYATQTTGRIHGVGLRYVAAGRELTVAKFNRSVSIDAAERGTTIAGRPATLESGPTTSLAWNCDEYSYTVRGTGIAVDRIYNVSRSVGCPA